MKGSAQDVRLGELSAPLIAEKQARLPLTNEILEHLRYRWVQIDLTLTAFGLQIIVNLTPPRLLTDFDCGAVRGNIAYVYPQSLTKSQPRRCAERVEHTVIFLFGGTDNGGHYTTGQDGLLRISIFGQIDEVVIPSSRIERVPFFIDC